LDVNWHAEAPRPRSYWKPAEEIGVPVSTLYTWIQRGCLPSRLVKATGRTKLVRADAATIAEIKALRATPAPWRRLPLPFIPTNQPNR